MRAIPRPSWRDSENAPVRLADGGTAGVPGGVCCGTAGVLPALATVTAAVNESPGSGPLPRGAPGLFVVAVPVSGVAVRGLLASLGGVGDGRSTGAVGPAAAGAATLVA